MTTWNIRRAETATRRRVYGILLLLSILCLQPALPAAEIVYTPPSLPKGVNPAIIPAPRQDWLERVQNNFNRSSGKKCDLIFDGDSITDGWQGIGKTIFAQRYGKLNVMDFAISGDRVENVLWRLQKGQLDGLNPQMIVLMIGTNNIGRATPEQIAAGIEALVKEYLTRAPEARLLLLNIFPRGPGASDPMRLQTVKINELLTGMNFDHRVTMLDLAPKFLTPDGSISKDIMPDFLHPSIAGYQIWADAIQPEIDKVFGARSHGDGLPPE